MTDSSRARAEENTSRWLDAEQGESDSLEVVGQDLNPDFRSQIGDAQLIDAMIAHLSNHDDEEKEVRIRRVMESIRDSRPTIAQDGRRAYWPRLATAAAILMIVVFGCWQFVRTRVSAAERIVQYAREIATQNVDRTYQAAFSIKSRRNGRLYVRGDDKYLVEWMTSGKKVLIGCDGAEHWLLSEDGEVYLSDRPMIPRLLRMDGDSQLTFLHVSEILDLMLDCYELEHLPTVNGDQHVRASRTHPTYNVPDSIDLWADATTGVAKRVVLRRNSFRWITLDLVSTEPLTANWFDYKHHVPSEAEKAHEHSSTHE